MKQWSGGDNVEHDIFGNTTMGVRENLYKDRKWMDNHTFYLYEPGDEALVTEFVDKAIEAGTVGADTEGTGLDTRCYDGKYNDTVVGFCLSYDQKFGVYIPIAHQDSSLNMDRDFLIGEMKRLFKNCHSIWWNAPYDFEIMRDLGIDIWESDDFEDAQIAWWLCDSDKHKNMKSLKKVSEFFLGKKMLELSDIFVAEEKNKNFSMITPEEGFIYAASDSIITLEIWDEIKKNKIFQMQELVYSIEKKLVSAINWTERNQFKIDVPYFQGLRKECLTKQEEIRKNLYKLAGREFNIDSPDQLGNVLANTFGLPLNKTKSGQWATNKDELGELAKNHEESSEGLRQVLKYRNYGKVIGTYIKPLLENRDEFDQVKFNFNQMGADTGRFSSSSSKKVGKGGKLIDSGVNGQNLPSVEKSVVNIRKGFIARPGFIVAAIDYSGVELRIAANMSGCKAWIEEFTNGTGDLHTLTARDAYNIPKDQPVDSKLRKTAKAINFGLLYGGGAGTIADTAGVSKNEGFRLMKNFFSGVPELERWLKSMKVQAKKKGYVQSAFKRTFLLPDAKSDDRRIASACERKAVNSPIQGSSADITKMAMVKVAKLIRERGWEEDCKMLMTVHDEIVFEIREEMMFEIIPELIKTMKSCTYSSWPVPLDVDCEWNYNWGECHYHGKLGWDHDAAVKAAKKAGEEPPEKSQELLDLEAKLAVCYGAEPAPAKKATKKAAPKQEPKQESKQESKKADVAKQATPIETRPVPQASKGTASQAQAITEARFVVSPPLNKWKWRRFEACFILCAADIYTDGACKLNLVDEKGQDLLGDRVIYVNRQAFYFESVRQGLVSGIA